MKRKKEFVLLAMVPIIGFFLIFIGCNNNNSGDLTTTVVQDDGESPQTPLWQDVQPEFLYTDESPNQSTKYFSVYLSWKPVTTNSKGSTKKNIIAYKIYRDDKDKAVGVVSYGKEEYEDQDLTVLQSGKRITYYVSAVDSQMRESFSGPQMVDLQTYGAEPQPPMNFFLIPGTGNQVTLSWTEPENMQLCKNSGDEISKYRIQKHANNDAWKTIAMIPVESNYYVDEGLSPGNTYYYRVYAITHSGNGSLPSDERSIYFEHKSEDLLARSTAPENVSAVMFETTSNPYAVKVAWQRPIWNDDGQNGQDLCTDVVAFKVYRADTGTFDLTSAWGLIYKPIKIVYNLDFYVDSTVNLHTDTQTHFYRISAVNTRGVEGDLSYPVSVYTGYTTTGTKTPLRFRCTTDNEGKITFYWEFDANVEEYNILYSKNGIVYQSFKTLSKDSFPGYKTGDEVTCRDENYILDQDILYFKLQAYDHATRNTASNYGYYVKAEKPFFLTSDKVVIEAEDLVESCKVRSVWYAWYAQNLYHDRNISASSLWDYDLQRGEHYNMGVKTVWCTDDSKPYQCLYFDTMGRQHPPQESSPSNLFVGISDEVYHDDYVYTDLIDNNYSNTLLDERIRVLYPAQSPDYATVPRMCDSVRPIFKAKSKLSSSDNYNYQYITTYNDDGYSYWNDTDGNGVDLYEFYYVLTENPLLQHGMEGKDLHLDYDVDPWTNKTPTNFSNYHLGLWDNNYNWNYQYYEDWYLYHIPYYDFWWMLTTYKDRDFNYYYWFESWKQLDNWPANNYLNPMWLQIEISGDKTFTSRDVLPTVGLYNGGCAYFIGPDSNTKFVAKDYFADNFRAYGWDKVYPINWRSNYFGPLYSNSSPWYTGWWPNDAHQIVYTRNWRKDNSITFDEYGQGQDYTGTSWISPEGNNFSNIMYNTYDMYQEQLEFTWSPQETGYYNIDLYFLETSHSGNYMVIVKQKNQVVGAPFIINLSERGTDKDSGGFNNLTKATSSTFDATIARDGSLKKVYLYENQPVEFIFCCLGSNKVRDVFTTNYEMSMGSVFEMYLDRLEITKVQLNETN
ncbi:MAG: fibronectin type III domain-containing protein [Candidatus Wallbacteria bacterium]|nr:fibronectin type III domain-containing protein [Candidatus Wallbacteria bacterium]